VYVLSRLPLLAALKEGFWYSPLVFAARQCFSEIDVGWRRSSSSAHEQRLIPARRCINEAPSINIEGLEL
jgi:hypothetical protein